MAKEVFLLDYELLHKHAHCYNYDRSVRAACERLGVPVRIFVCKFADEAFRREISAEPLFSRRWIDWEEGTPIEDYLQQVANFNLEFLSDLVPLTSQVGPDSVIFMPAIRVERLMGLQTWLAAFPREKMPNVVIMLRFDISENTLFRHALAQYKLLGPKVRFCVDTEELQQAYARVGCSADVVPIPHAAAEGGDSLPTNLDPAIAGFFDASGGPVVSWFGVPRFLKGFHLLPEIIEHLLDVGHDLRFMVQALSDSSLVPLGKEHVDAAFQRLRALAEKHERVLWIDMAVEEDLYRYLMARSDIVLMPYVGQRYRTDSSGIFSEAVAAGKISIVPEGSSMGNEAKRRSAAAVTFQNAEPAAIALAVVKALANRDALQKSAAKVVENGWAALHSPDRLAEYLLA